MSYGCDSGEAMFLRQNRLVTLHFHSALGQTSPMHGGCRSIILWTHPDALILMHDV